MSVVGFVSLLYVRVRDHTHIHTLAQQAVNGAISSALQEPRSEPQGSGKRKKRGRIQCVLSACCGRCKAGPVCLNNPH